MKCIETPTLEEMADTSPSTAKPSGSATTGSLFAKVKVLLSRDESYQAAVLLECGYSETEHILSGREFVARFQSSEKPKSRFYNPELGKGVVNGESSNNWSDWPEFARRHNVGIQRLWELAPKNGSIATRKEPKVTAPARQDRPTEQTTNSGFPKLQLLEWDEGNQRLAKFLLLKKGWSPDSLETVIDAGIRFAKYKFGKGWQQVLATPVYGENLLKEPPVNWMVMRIDGRKWPLSDGPVSTMTMSREHGGRAGIAIDRRVLERVDSTAWMFAKTEGHSDFLALLLRDDRPETLATWTNPFGCDKANSTFRNDRWMLELFRGRESIVIHDCDDAGQLSAVGNPDAKGEKRFGWCRRLTQCGSPAKNVVLPNPADKKGFDLRDYFAGGGTVAEILSIAEQSEVVEIPDDTDEVEAEPTENEGENSEDDDDTRARIAWTDNEETLVEKTIEAIYSNEFVFQRGNTLVEPVIGRHPIEEDVATAVIRPIPNPKLRALCTASATFFVEHDEGDRPKTITNTLVNQVASWGSYKGVRELASVMDYPYMRPDGSICAAYGYDESTKTFQTSSLELGVPSKPTFTDATESGNRLLELIKEFSFCETHHRSCFIAALLTMIARPMIRGPVPGFEVAASMQGAGKTRIVDLVTTIATGRCLPRMSWPEKEEELAKHLTAIAISGVPACLFDNIKTLLGGPSIEAFHTSTTWRGRILGRSEETPELPIRQVIFYTANNSRITADMARRLCYIRIEPNTEDPTAQAFEIEDIVGHASENRSQLLSDAFTILRASLQSSETVDMAPWGGYEAWSSIVRRAIVWTGQPDPYKATTERKAETAADDIFPDLLDAMVESGIGETGLSSREMCDIVNATDGNGGYANARLRGLLMCLTRDQAITPPRLSSALRKFSGRVSSGRKLKSVFNSHQKVKQWLIQSI